MSESAKAAFNDQLRNKVAGKAPVEKKAPPEELVERAGAAIEELQAVIAELAVADPPADEEVTK